MDRPFHLLAVLLLASTYQLVAADLHVTVVDSTGGSVAGAHVQLKVGTRVLGTKDTDANGSANFPNILAGTYEVVGTKDGFRPASEHTSAVEQPVRLTLVPAENHDSVNVSGTADPLQQGSSGPSELSAKTAKELPGRPATVADALPLIPGVIRKPDGSLEMSASPEHRSALIVNSADVTDPATGQFGLTVPIDSVESISVFQTPFLAEYGRFTAGLVSVETRRGGDEWKWELNDPLPEFFIRSYHLRGLKDATPRVNAEGPIVAGKLFFSEGLEYEVRKVQVHTLPFPYDQKKNSGINSFAQLDWVISDKQLLTATAHVAPQRMSYVNLDFFNPQSTRPNAATHNYTETVTHKWSRFGGLLDNTVSITQFDAHIWGQGDDDFVVTPTGNSGNYFSTQDRSAFRFGWSPSFTFKPWKRMGTHDFKVGAYIAHSSDDGQASSHPVDIMNREGLLTEQITFFGTRPFSMDDTEYSFYGQDHWTLSSKFAVDLGIRSDSQEVSGSFRIAPRIGMVWTPFPKWGTVVRGGFGIFYDRVPLNVYSFSHFPREILTYYDANGDISEGPFFYGNALGEVDLHQRFVFRRPVEGNFSPQSVTGSFQVEQPITKKLRVRVNYMQKQSRGLVILNTIPPDPITQLGAHELTGDGVSRYRELEFTGKFKLTPHGEFMVSYTRSRGRGDLNDFGSYLGSFPTAILRPNEFGDLPGNVPNRFLAWGSFQLPQGFRVSPIFEYRTGFPYSTFDAAQNYAAPANSQRYPGFLSLDSRISKDFKVNPKYTVRLSVTDFNLSNHFNPEAYHNNTADPAHGLFFGSRARRFTADFDVLF